jgi:tRNA threonylcarbamoyladenosine biosynthesis protein TsaB
MHEAVILRRATLNSSHVFPTNETAPHRRGNAPAGGRGRRLMAALLAFDTATERLHLGLAVGADSWLHDSEGGARASSSLIADLRGLLAEAHIGWRDLDAIAFGRGPGAFTGLRTACSVAQGLAFGANRPVLPLDTLMAVAEHARVRAGTCDVWVAMDARMDEVYAAHYVRVDDMWQTVAVPALYTLEALHARWREGTPRSIAGTAPAAFGMRLDCGAAQVVADARPVAHALLTCAQAAWARGSAVDPALALPLYLRDRVALTSAEREADRAGRGER